MYIIKRDGEKEIFKQDKIIDAICKAMLETGAVDTTLARGIAQEVEDENKYTIEMLGLYLTVEQVQDIIEDRLMKSERKDVARKYIVYREKRNEKRQKGWQLTDIQKDIWERKYQHRGESFDDWIKRVSNGNKKIAKLIRQKRFLFGGRILANRGLQNQGRKVTFSNCYVLPAPKDNIESIYGTCAEEARTFSYGGGVGFSIGGLRPRGAKVNNSANTTTGAVSFMDTFSKVSETIGQNGRRGALMLSIPIHHPDIYEFLEVKNNPLLITKANISVMISDGFMQCVVDDTGYDLHFKVEDTGEEIRRNVNARELYRILCTNAWKHAEPGMLFWNKVLKHNLMDLYGDYNFVGTNPCAEEPLIEYGACLLGSINLSEFVIAPFTQNAMIDFKKLEYTIKQAIIALNEVVDENIELHPLAQQRETARKYRAIGLGIMGFADMLLKLGIAYGSEKSIALSEALSHKFLCASVEQSALLAKEHGAFHGYDYKKTSSSLFYQQSIPNEVDELVQKYGLRNAQLLSIAPTGSISTMLDISGGIEPIFANSYTRKSESLYEEDTYYKVYTPIVKQYMEEKEITKEEDLPDYFVTSHNIPWVTRLMVQSAWQTYVDAAISSTVNLPNETSIEDVEDLYMTAWRFGLKGVTIYRDGCQREGVLTIQKEEKEELTCST